MSKLKKIAYDCRKATLLIEKRQMAKLTLQERAELTIHLTRCSVCRLYQQQSIAINAMIRKLFSSTATSPRLRADYKDSLQQQINERLQ
jgi:hypothetical protein